jgi:K+ transporter
MPQINYALLAGVVILVLAFHDSDSLAAAYGIAVTGTFLCTSILAGHGAAAALRLADAQRRGGDGAAVPAGPLPSSSPTC